MMFDELEPTGDDTSMGGDMGGDMGGAQDDTTEAAPEEGGNDSSEGEGEAA